MTSQPYVKKNATPDDANQLAQAIKQAADGKTPVYPLGGQTSLDYGLTPSEQGLGLSLAGLNRIIDYPARDMTITVEAGLTMAAMQQALAAEGQWLPLDVPQAQQATVGGAVAANPSGARRYVYGTMRDYVIGIAAVDGRGVQFHGGGRVVKNVAGYDFCKLLTGSLGTLAVITQITLKVRPRPPASAFLVVDLPAWHERPAAIEKLLAALVTSHTTPAAIELLTGPAWSSDPALGDAPPHVSRLAVGVEGTQVEVDWMLQSLSDEWLALGCNKPRRILGEAVPGLWSRLCEFPVCPQSPLVLKISVLPSRVVQFMKLLTDLDPQISLQAHAGDGVLIARFHTFEVNDISRVLVGQVQAQVAQAGGHVVVLSHAAEGTWTRRAVWGGTGDERQAMQAVKQQRDPHGILNPGRFVYA